MPRWHVRRRGTAYTIGGVTLALVLAVIAVLVITQTDWGRERVRRYVIESIEQNSRARVSIERVTGNLLSDLTLHGVSITDSAGAPFIRAEEISAGYELLALWGRRIDLSDVRLVRPVVVLDRKPGGQWNYDLLFPRDTTPTGKPRGWGTWIRFTDVTVINGDLSIRSPWAPNSRLTGAERADAIRRALSPEGRLLVERVAGGYQKISSFHEIYGKLPLLRISDPDHETRLADVDSIYMIAEPFRPPAATFTSLTGAFEFTSDSIWWVAAEAQMPGSRVAGSGRYDFETDDMSMRIRGNPVAAGDLRWIYTRIPERGGGTLEFSLDWIGDTSIYVVRNADVRLEGSRIRGDLGLTITDDYRFHDTELRFTNLETGLFERLFPDVDVPRQGVLSGRTALEGNLARMTVDGDVTFDDRLTGRSRMLAVGELGFVDGAFVASDLRLTMRPVQVELARELVPDLPLGGTLSGTATLNGSTESRMTARADVTHVEQGSTSRITGTGTIRAPPGTPAGRAWFDIDARVHPLALATVGRFFPEAGLRGTATGPVRLTGTPGSLSVRTNLGFADGGSASIEGQLDLAAAQIGYDVALGAHLFNAGAISTKAPRTSLTAAVSAEGRGLDPETMRARISADVAASSWDTVQINSATVRVAVGDGLARVDSLALDIPYGFAVASGTFGLRRDRSGELRYQVDIDSLSRLAGLLPAQEGAVPPRPGILAQRMARAKADSARRAAASEVERAATGAPPPVLARVDTPQVVHRQKLSGSIRADGVATGNIRSFGARGTASGEDIVALGNTVESFTASYDWTNALTPESNLTVEASAANLLAAGFDLDSVRSRLEYRKPSGSFTLDIHQDDRTEYGAEAQFTLNRDRNELRLNQLRLEFDTTLWTSTSPSLVHWGPAGVEVEQLELRNKRDGRIFIDGLLPTEGEATFKLAVDNFPVENLITLTQSDIDARGLVSFDLDVAGTAESPRFRGAFGAEQFVYDGTAIPEIHGVVTYENENLTGRADAMRAGEPPMLTAEGTIPVNLALRGVTGSRLPTDRQIDVAITADTLPLDMVPQLTEYVSNTSGRAFADFRVAGTLSRPEITGRFTVTEGRGRVVPLGIDLRNVTASIRMLGDTVIVDSLVAHSRGRLAVTGGLGIGSWRAPSFDLRFNTVNAEVLDNDRGTLRASAQISMTGPFDDAYVSGNLRIHEGVVHIPESDDKDVIGADDPALFNVLDTGVVADRELFPAQSPLLANLRMLVNLRVDRDVFVRSREANVEVYSEGDLVIRVNRATETLTLDGILLSERGEYTFLTKRFNIRRGSATFVNVGHINPMLQVTGEYAVQLSAREALNIRILIGGTLLNPRISLESDAQPPIPQSDLLSYLAFGRSSSSLLQLEGSALGSSNNLVGAGAALATKQLASVALGVMADEFAGEAARSLGADVFNITPADIQTDVGNFLRATEVEFGKYYRSHTFFSLRTRLDPAALQRPGLFLSHRFGGTKGYRFETSFEPRYLLREPTLAPRDPLTTSVFGLFLIREWRY